MSKLTRVELKSRIANQLQLVFLLGQAPAKWLGIPTAFQQPPRQDLLFPQ